MSTSRLAIKSALPAFVHEAITSRVFSNTRFRQLFYRWSTRVLLSLWAIQMDHGRTEEYGLIIIRSSTSCLRFFLSIATKGERSVFVSIVNKGSAAQSIFHLFEYWVVKKYSGNTRRCNLCCRNAPPPASSTQTTHDQRRTTRLLQAQRWAIQLEHGRTEEKGWSATMAGSFPERSTIRPAAFDHGAFYVRKFTCAPCTPEFDHCTVSSHH